jgi:hypothetical protein
LRARARRAIRNFNLTHMNRGRNAYQASHCYSLADHMVEAEAPSAGEQLRLRGSVEEMPRAGRPARSDRIDVTRFTRVTAPSQLAYPH